MRTRLASVDLSEGVGGGAGDECVVCAGVVRIVVDSVQLVALACAPVRSWPPFVLAVRGVVSGGSFVSLSAVHVACIGPVAGVFGHWSQLTVSGVVVPLALTIAFLATETAVRHGWLATKGSVALFLRRMSLTLLLYVFVAAVQSYIDVFTCVSGPTAGDTVLLRDSSVTCGGSEQVTAAVVAASALGAWTAGIVAAGLALWRARDSAVLELPSVFRPYGPIYWVFRRRLAAFVSVGLARRLICVVAVGATPLVPTVGLALAAVVNIAYCALVFAMRPYVPMVREIVCWHCGPNRRGVWVDSLNVADVVLSGATAVTFIGSLVDIAAGGVGSDATAAAGAVVAATAFTVVGTALGLVLCAARGRESGDLRATGPALVAELERLETMMRRAASDTVRDLLLAEELHMQVVVLRRCARSASGGLMCAVTCARSAAGVWMQGSLGVRAAADRPGAWIACSVPNRAQTASQRVRPGAALQLSQLRVRPTV